MIDPDAEKNENNELDMQLEQMRRQFEQTSDNLVSRERKGGEVNGEDGASPKKYERGAVLKLIRCPLDDSRGKKIALLRLALGNRAVYAAVQESINGFIDRYFEENRTKAEESVGSYESILKG